jgi:hypothetical protein
VYGRVVRGVLVACISLLQLGEIDRVNGGRVLVVGPQKLISKVLLPAIK